VEINWFWDELYNINRWWKNVWIKSEVINLKRKYSDALLKKKKRCIASKLGSVSSLFCKLFFSNYIFIWRIP
jgi:hypothetical protein